MANVREAFISPMTKAERVLGIAYIPLHAAVIPMAIGILAARVIPGGMTEVQQNGLYYAVGFLFLLIAEFRFLRGSFSAAIDSPGRTLAISGVCFLAYYMIAMAVAVVMLIFVEDPVNPNTGEVLDLVRENKNAMLAVAVLLAPVVEETMFRGALFGTVAEKSRIAAYIVTALVFAVYHLWAYMVIDFDWQLLVYLLQYIPASVVLCFCYEKSGTIWAPILVHAGINLAATLAGTALG